MINANPDSIAVEKVTSDADERDRIIALTETSESRELRIKLAAAYRLMARAGLDDGVAGHISLRVPGAPDCFWVNPFGLLFSEVRADNLVVVNKQGEIVHGGNLINLAGFLIHSAIHHARPDVHCACHSHPPAGSAFSALGMLLDPLDQTGCSFFEDHALYSEYTGIVLDGDQTTGIVKALGTKRALILANHGLLTCAGTVEQALIDMLDMERTCKINMAAMSTGRPVKAAPPEVALQSRAVLTNPRRYPFQWAALIRALDRDEPDYNPWR